MTDDRMSKTRELLDVLKAQAMTDEQEKRMLDYVRLDVTALVTELAELRADVRQGLALVVEALCRQGRDQLTECERARLRQYIDGYHATETAFWETPKDETVDPPSTEEKTPV